MHPDWNIPDERSHNDNGPDGFATSIKAVIVIGFLKVFLWSNYYEEVFVSFVLTTIRYSITLKRN